MTLKYSILFTTLILAGLAQAQQQEQADTQTKQDAKRLEVLNQPAISATSRRAARVRFPRPSMSRVSA